MLITKADPFTNIHTAADKAAPGLAKELLTALQDLSDGLPNLAALLASEGPEAVMRAVGGIALPDDLYESLLNAQLQIALETADPVASAFGVAFNSVNEAAVAWANTNAAALVTNITAVNRTATAQIINTGLQAGWSNPVIAAQIEPLIGLLPRHQGTIARFMAGFDDPAFAARQGAKRAAKLLRWRANMIARTETIRAANMGQQLAWQTAQDAGRLPQGVRKVWIATDDSRTCPICHALDGAVIDLQGSFALNQDANGKAVNIAERTPPRASSVQVCRGTRHRLRFVASYKRPVQRAQVWPSSVTAPPMWGAVIECADRPCTMCPMDSVDWILLALLGLIALGIVVLGAIAVGYIMYECAP